MLQHGDRLKNNSKIKGICQNEENIMCFIYLVDFSARRTVFIVPLLNLYYNDMVA